MPPSSQPRVAPRFKGNKILCLMTRRVGTSRLLLKQRKVKTSQQIFYWRHGAYYVDPSQIFMFGKIPYLMYDVDITEPLTLTIGKTMQTHIPQDVTTQAHWSPDVELLLKQGAIKQALGAIKAEGMSFNWMMLIFLVIGVALGYFIGSAMPFSSIASMVPKATTQAPAIPPTQASVSRSTVTLGLNIIPYTSNVMSITSIILIILATITLDYLGNRRWHE